MQMAVQTAEPMIAIDDTFGQTPLKRKQIPNIIQTRKIQIEIYRQFYKKWSFKSHKLSANLH